MLTRISAALFALYLVHSNETAETRAPQPAASRTAESTTTGGLVAEAKKAALEAGAHAPRAAIAYCLEHPDICRRALETAGELARPAGAPVKSAPAAAAPPLSPPDAAPRHQAVEAPLPPRRPAGLEKSGKA